MRNTGKDSYYVGWLFATLKNPAGCHDPTHSMLSKCSKATRGPKCIDMIIHANSPSISFIASLTRAGISLTLDDIALFMNFYRPGRSSRGLAMVKLSRGWVLARSKTESFFDQRLVELCSQISVLLNIILNAINSIQYANIPVNRIDITDIISQLKPSQLIVTINILLLLCCISYYMCQNNTEYIIYANNDNESYG